MESKINNIEIKLKEILNRKITQTTLSNTISKCSPRIEELAQPKKRWVVEPSKKL
jgi:hypothetical protein